MVDPFDPMKSRLDEVVKRLDRLTGHDAWLDVSDHHDRLRQVEQRLGHHSLHALHEQVEQLDEQVSKVTDESTDSAATARRLEARLRVLERRLRASGDIKAVDLDRWPARAQTLVTAIRRGAALRPKLLAANRKSTLEHRIGEPDRLRESRRRSIATAIEAARTIAGAELTDDDTWASAYSAWSGAVTAINEVTPRITAARETARDLRKQLNTAVAQHDAVKDAVEDGERARTALRLLVRTRLGEALRDDLLLPGWFETVLGPTVSPEHPEQWLRTAVDVVVYRLVHQVDDLAIALGDRPAESGWQQHEYTRLVGDCSMYRT